jgi:GLPGLI family protein
MKKLTVKFVILVSAFTVSCRNNTEQSVITAGRIDYKITYLNNDIDKRARNVLPSKMKLCFNEKQASNNIEGFMGMYKLNAFTNFHTRKCSTMLKVFDQHYLFKGNRDEQMCCFDTMDDMEIMETDETKMVAGFECKKAIVKLPATNESFIIFYTNQIKLRHPNATNPYRKIKGVLMEFELKLVHLNMRFVAESYHELDSASLEPDLNNQSKYVSRTQMTQILNKLLQ